MILCYFQTPTRVMAVIYSELLEDYFLTNIKDDLFKDTDEADEDDDSMTSCKFSALLVSVISAY